MKLRSTALSALCLMTVVGCTSQDTAQSKDDSDLNGVGMGVGQGGSQDFGQFREILESGDIPGPNTIDDVGFFNEHKIELPTPECNENVCIHARLGLMGNMISGSDCTVVLIGMNTPINPEELERPPLNLSLAIDISGSMSGDSIAYAKAGLTQMVDVLQPGDKVTLIGFSTEAQVLVRQVGPEDPALLEAINNLGVYGGTNIYDGLRLAFEEVDSAASAELQNRVILLSDGVATSGIESSSHIVGLAEAYRELGYSLTTIGMGTDFDVDLMRDLAETGGGAFYFLEDPEAVEEVFTDEVETFLVPLAEQVEIDLTVSEDYNLRNVYGTKTFDLVDNASLIEIPSLQIAHRTSTSDTDGGRRGGGGAIIAEMLPVGNPDAGEIGVVDFAYTDPVTGERVSQRVDVASPVSPQEVREEGWFVDPAVEKGFVMLNMYVGFQMASEMASIGNDNGALSILSALQQNAGEWVETHDDEDVIDDLRYVDMFIENIRDRGLVTNTTENVTEPWGWD